MTRTLIIDTPHQIGATVTLKGWVNSRRDHGKIVFIDLRDRTGLVQVVLTGDLAGTLHSEDVVYVTGLVKARPEKLVNLKLATGTVEIEGQKIELISKAAELPFDMGGEKLDVQLPTLLDYRSLTLRHPRVKSIFAVQAAVAESFRQAARSLGCTEVFPPTVSASSTEGGAETLQVNYFGYPAFMVQSPQLYKQMLVGVFERVFLISHIYRTEPSVTTRHLVESIQLDCEIGYIDGFSDLLDALEQTFSRTISLAQTASAQYLDFLGVSPSHITAKVPRLTMREAQELIFKRTGVDHRTEIDMMPEDEREICKWALEEHDSDLVTITHFPTKKRAFYSLPDPANPEYSLSYDLLYKGLEISSGSQRIHNYDQLVDTIRSRGMDPHHFEMYLQAFRYGMPEHGGFSYGLERTTMKLLDLPNIREASLYPRDVERVDFRLSEMFPKTPVDSLPSAGEKVYENISHKLDAAHITYKTLDHAPTKTSEASAQVRGTDISQGAKALIMYADSKPVMAVVSAAKKVDLPQLKQLLGAADLHLATADQAKKITGLEIGAIPPFGSLFNLKTYVDESLVSQPQIAFNAGLHTKSIIMSYEDYQKAETPVVGSFS